MEERYMNDKNNIQKPTITIKAMINVPIEKIWRDWTETEHIKRWNYASEDWHTPHAENDLRVGGRFLQRMEAKDGSFGFDLTGTYDEIKLYEVIAYTLDDGRKVKITFNSEDDKIFIIVTFEAESSNSLEMQQNGWQAILDNFKKYTQSLINTKEEI
jgi:uncharacterized protein YndB with AHSA1/START domain